MGKKDNRNLKRNKKLKARKQRHGELQENLAYHGNKYKANELVPFHLEAETAIFECFLMAKRSLTDHDIKAALVQMVIDIRRSRIKPVVQLGDSPESVGNMQDFIILNIRCHWGRLCDGRMVPGSETFAGILRTILGSIETRRSPGPDSRGYLDFLDGFLKKCGKHAPFFKPGETFKPAVPMLEGG